MSLLTPGILRTCNKFNRVQYNQGRTGPPGSLALARWAGWSCVHVGRHVRCWSRSNDLSR